MLKSTFYDKVLELSPQILDEDKGHILKSILHFATYLQHLTNDLDQEALLSILPWMRIMLNEFDEYWYKNDAVLALLPMEFRIKSSTFKSGHKS